VKLSPHGTRSATELRFHLREGGGIRTRDLVVAIEVTDLFTTGSALILSGTVQTRFGERPRTFHANSCSKDATRRPSRGRLHGSRAATGGVRSRLCPERSIRALGRRQSVSRGTSDTGVRLDLQSKYPASSPPGIQTLLRFRMTKASERLETKTPPEHGLGRGSNNRTCERASAHSTSTRRRARADIGSSAWLKSVQRAACD
jgi:hypothetical protein